MAKDISLPKRVSRQAGHGGLDYLELRFAGAVAHVYLHGGHVLHYQPAGQAPVLWHSRQSWFEAGKPIRGGIPVCWPWFGAHPSDSTQPNHGFVRLAEWQAVAAVATAETTTIVLRFPMPAEFPATLELTVALADQLSVALTTTNGGTAPLPIAEALHSYFAVGDVRTISVAGLAGRPYIDTVPPSRPVVCQVGDIQFAEEVDRIYFDNAETCTIVDPELNRRIRVGKEGSRSTVVWNPWMAKAARMPDYGDHEYPQMVCVETANCGADAPILVPGERHCLTTHIQVEPF